MLIVQSGRNPLAVTLLALLVVASVGQLTGSEPTEFRDAFDDPWPTLFYAGLAVASTLSLVGVFLPGLIGPQIERLGMVLMAGPLAAFGVVAITFNLGLSIGLLGLAVGAGWRAIQIWRDLSELRFELEVRRRERGHE